METEPQSRYEPEGLSTLDGVALVTGAAMASIHVRALFTDLPGPFTIALIVVLFCWMSLASAGPFVFAVRRFVRHLGNYPGLGDRLWLLAGVPWILAGVVRTGSTSSNLDPGSDRPYAAALIGSVSVAIGWGLLIVLRHGAAACVANRSWTEWAGLLCTGLWPLQALTAFVILNS